MKRILFIFTLLIAFSLTAIAQKQIPPFSFTDLEGNSFTQENIEDGKAAIFMFFDPWCDHCATQAGWIAEAAESFKDVQLVFVTTEPEAQPSRDFKSKHFGDADLPHLHFVIDTEFMFDGYFDGYYEVPSILIYDASGKHAKTYSKESSAETLLKHI